MENRSGYIKINEFAERGELNFIYKKWSDFMIIDMHFHTREYSSCSNIEIEKGIKKAIKRGLDGICITDHDNIGMKDRVKFLNEKYNINIFVGAEVLTHEGDFLVYGVNKIPTEKIYAFELIKIVEQQGGVVFAAHPFREFNGINRAAGEKIKNFPGLTGIEVLNGKTTYNNNLEAFKMAKELEKIMIGGSDAHEVEEIGKYATFFSGHVRNMNGLVEKIKSGNCFPLIYDYEKEDYILPLQVEENFFAENIRKYYNKYNKKI